MTSATTPKTVVLGGVCHQREAVASATITPGMLVAVAAGDLIAAHGTADQQAQSAWALEYALTGRGIDDDYLAGDQVIYGIAEEGSEIYALLASGQNVADRAKLTSAGNGRLKAASTDDFVVAEAREAVDASGGAARIRVEISRGRSNP